jgi:endo-1,4-beta-xylanase
MKKILNIVCVLVFSVVVLYAQKPEESFVTETRNYYKDIDPTVFRDARPVLEAGYMANFKAYGAGVVGNKASSKQIQAKGFTNVIEVETHDVFYNDWDVEIGAPSSFPILENDLIYITFWIRCLGSRDESNQGYARVYLQQNGPPWQKSTDVSIVAGSEWIQYKIPFRAKYQHYDTKKAAVAFALGYSHQTIQIADMRVTNVGTYIADEQLPKTKFTYKGREQDAQWRKEAEARIEKIRKGDIQIIVKDKKGAIVPNAQVKVTMQNHTFGFGNIVNRQSFSNPGPKGEAYRKIIKENFNQVTFENELKHDMWLQYKKEGRTDKIFETIDSLDAWGIKLRGHAMVWPSTRYTNIAKEYIDKKDSAGLEKLIEAHIQEVATAVKGRVIDWDVMNEPYVNHQFMDLVGKDKVLQWFRLARQYEPKADLFINETRDIVDGGTNTQVLSDLQDWVKYLKANNVEINGLGFQGHFGETGLTSPEKILEILDDFSKLNLKIKITELDIQTLDDQLQADYFRDFYTVIYSHPTMQGILSWGFWEDAHWWPEAAWYRSDFSQMVDRRNGQNKRRW